MALKIGQINLKEKQEYRDDLVKLLIKNRRILKYLTPPDRDWAEYLQAELKSAINNQGYRYRIYGSMRHLQKQLTALGKQ